MESIQKRNSHRDDRLYSNGDVEHLFGIPEFGGLPGEAGLYDGSVSYADDSDRSWKTDCLFLSSNRIRANWSHSPMKSVAFPDVDEKRLKSEAIRVLVAQLGSRAHYVLPMVLQDLGCLEIFYTDFAIKSPLMRSLCSLMGRRGRKIAQRWPEGISANRVRSFNSWTSRRILSRKRQSRSQMHYWIQNAEEFSQRIIRRGFGQANTVYAFSTAANSLFQEARRRGLYCVLDHATAPAEWEMARINEAWEAHPQWFPEPPQDPYLEEYAALQRSEWEASHQIVIISNLLKRMIEESGGPSEKCVYVPLAVDVAKVEIQKAAPGRDVQIGFVGDDGLRKGLGDFLWACESLGLNKDNVHVAGAITLSKDGREFAEKRATLYGRLTRAETSQLFSKLDVFVLPSYSDTFGIVVLEAIAHGCIPIVTDCTGAADVVVDGENGFVVEAGSKTMLAERMSQLLGDGAMRKSMAQNASGSSKEFTTEKMALLLEIALGKLQSKSGVEE